MPFDLILRGGRVLDPGRGTDATLDVAFADGRVAAKRETGQDFAKRRRGAGPGVAGGGRLTRSPPRGAWTTADQIGNSSREKTRQRVVVRCPQHPTPGPRRPGHHEHVKARRS